ncbi:MAG: DUF1501 domain-containing protein [Aquabacterium sp.]
MASTISRREFLKRSGTAASVAGAGAPLVMNLVPSSALAGTTSGYKALVCVFLAGGNDAYNTVIRTDRGLQRFVAARETVSREVLTVDGGSIAPKLALALSAAQNRTSIAGLSLALHPALSNIKQLIEQGRMAVIGNAGPLAAPTTATAYLNGTVAVPPKLFSHNDQTSMWQSGQPEGATSGWGGELVRRFAETNLINGQASQLFSAVAMESTPVFCAGTSAKMPDAKPVVAPFGASRAGGALRPGGLEQDPAGGPTAPYLIRWAIDREVALPPLFAGTVGRGEGTVAGVSANHLIEQDYVKKLNSANEAWKASSKAMAGVSNSVPVPAGNSLAEQLAVVARLIKSSGNTPLSLGRQVFFVQLGGFDTHSGQVGSESPHLKLLRQLDDALKFFDDELGADRSKVVTFTASEFGRKLNENGDGTDHGWGGHHFVMGGSVQGGAYGYFPDLSSWNDATRSYGDSQVLPDGTLVPSVPVDLIAKELGKWMGIDWSNASNAKVGAQLFPGLSASTPLLGFAA